MPHTHNQCKNSEDPLAEKTILVVEDDNSIGEMLVEAVTQETPYNVVLVNDGIEALQVLHDLRPSLFITDYRLPRMDGLELYDKLRETTASANIPVILMSAYLPTEEVKKRHLVGLSKPFDLDDFLEALNKILNDDYETAC